MIKHGEIWLSTVKVVRQAVLRYTMHGRYYQRVYEVSPGLGPVAIPFIDHATGRFAQLVLTHQSGDLTVSGLPVYQ